MVMYQVWAVCNACGDNHTMGTAVSLPGELFKQSIARAFSNKTPPANTAALEDIRLYCPKLGRHYMIRESFWSRVAERAEPSTGRSSFLEVATELWNLACLWLSQRGFKK